MVLLLHRLYNPTKSLSHIRAMLTISHARTLSGLVPTI